MKVVYTIFGLLLIQSAVYAQEERLSVAVELHPIYNTSPKRDWRERLSDLNKGTAGLSAGLAFYHKLSEKSKFDVHLRWNTLSQGASYQFTRNDIIFKADVANNYWVYALGASWHRKFIEKTYVSLGADANLMRIRSAPSSHSITNIPDGQSPTMSIDNKFDNLRRLHNFFSVSVGVMREISVGSKQGLVGFRYKAPLAMMPKFSHRINLDYETGQEDRGYSYTYPIYQLNFIIAYKIFRNFE